jgi:hypothetical protein
VAWRQERAKHRLRMFDRDLLGADKRFRGRRLATV